MQIKPSASIRQDYNEIAAFCKSTKEPVFLTKNGEGHLVVMDIDTYNRREKMLKLREELLSVEEDRLAGRAGTKLDELDKYLDGIIDEAEHGKETSIESNCFRPCPSDAGRPCPFPGPEKPCLCPQSKERADDCHRDGLVTTFFLKLFDRKNMRV